MMQPRLCLCLSAILLAVGAARARADAIDEQLAAIAKVGPMGAGNRDAALAWRGLAAAQADDMTRLLAALDDATPLAANWIRAAVDTVAERQINAGKPLPTSELEAFALDTSHSSHGRRLAYEWLARADAGAPDRLIPQMLGDPSLEFRRDAVARLIAEGDRSLAAEQKDAAREAYQQALAAALDLDQVKQLAESLKGLGVDVDMNRHFGFITDWKLIGPFDNTDMKGFAVAFPPESDVSLDAEHPGKSAAVKWFDHATDHELGEVDLNKAITTEQGVTAYALAEFYSDEARPIDIRLASVNANKVWLNGELLTANEVYHTMAEMDQYIAHGELRPGTNVILLKICQNEMTESWAKVWKFQCRVCDEVGTGVLSTDRKPAKPAAPAEESR